MNRLHRLPVVNFEMSRRLRFSNNTVFSEPVHACSERDTVSAARALETRLSFDRGISSELSPYSNSIDASLPRSFLETCSGPSRSIPISSLSPLLTPAYIYDGEGENEYRHHLTDKARACQSRKNFSSCRGINFSIISTCSTLTRPKFFPHEPFLINAIASKYQSS